MFLHYDGLELKKADQANLRSIEQEGFKVNDEQDVVRVWEQKLAASEARREGCRVLALTLPDEF